MQKRNLNVEIVKLSDIVPYSNNPRNNTNAIEPVKESISSFKFRVPIVLDKDKVIIAGHTRYESAKQLNLESVPCIILEDISDEDAKEFRIVDNKSSEYSEWDLEKLEQELSEIAECGFESILKWMEKKSETEYYGEYGLVEDLDGLYDSMAKNNTKEKIRLMREYFAEDYGEYYYEKLGVKSYNQLYCQPNRLSKSARQTLLRSDLYHSLVIDKVPKSYRILDFGAGRCAYVNYLRTRGYHIFAYEPNFQSNRNLDVGMVVKMINDIYNDVCVNGLFDIVITDSVLNSVVNAEVERIVLTACNTFLKKTGTMLIATRSLERLDGIYNAKKATDTRRDIEFLDKNNFSATFRDGVWTMQHFHSTETLKELLDDFFDDAITYLNTRAKTVMAVCHAPKVIPEDKVAEALEFELNMEYPNNYHHNKHLNLKSKLIELVKERNHEIQT